MRQPQRRAWRRPRPVITILGAVLSLLSLVLPATMLGAESAAAAPAAGYTASLIPTGAEAYSVAVNSATDTAYFADIYTGQVTVVDGAANAVTTTIPLTGSPRGIAVDPVTKTVYVVLYYSSATSSPAVAVINGSSNTVTDTIALPAGSGPMGVAVDSSTDTVYVAEDIANAVAVIDGSTNSVTTTVSTGALSQPRSVAVDETSGVVWVGGGGQVFGISGKTSTLAQTISLSAPVLDVAVDPGTNTVYAATTTDGVAVIDGATGTVTTHIAVTPAPMTVAVDPGSGTVFVSSYVSVTGSGTTWVIDESSNEIVDTIPRGGIQIAVDTATGAAYAAPYFAQANAAWVLAPSAANAWSPVIKSTSALFYAGTYGSYAIVGSALPAATYSETGTLPSGVTLSTSGVLSGTPAAGTGGAYPITLTATNGVAPDYSQPFTLYVYEAPALTAPSTTTFQVGTPVSVPIPVTGYPTPYVSATLLPPGLSLTQQANGTWQLTGTPSSTGVYNTVFSASNAAGTASVTAPITVLQAPSFNSAPTTTFLTGTSNGYQVAAACDPACTFSETGALPTGVTFTSAGVLSGKPSRGTQGVYSFTISATNSVGTTTQKFTLTVVAKGLFVPTGPVRVLDTRNGTGVPVGAVGPGQTITLQVTGRDGVPATGVTAVVLNVMAIHPTAASYLTIWPDGTARPPASQLDFPAGSGLTTDNLVTVPVGTNGTISFYNYAGTVNIAADLAGYYATATTGSTFTPAGPARVLDTRTGTGGYTGTVSGGQTITLQIDGTHGIPATGVTAVVLNVMAIHPTAASYLTIWPAGTNRPAASQLDFPAGPGLTTDNLVTVPVGADGKIDLYNYAGTVNIAADLAGYYTSP